MQPLVSVIVVNYNGRHYLKACFDSLLDGSYKNIEIIFVDNGSRDNSVRFVRMNYPRIKVVDNKANLGLAIASNLGAEQAGGKYLFFYNNDTIAEQGMIEELVTAAESDPGTGIFGCTTMTYDGKEVINSGVACDVYGYPYGGGEPLYVDAAIFIRKSVFDEIGGFDPKLFLYGEDRDICWRAQIYGHGVKVVPTAVFYHDSFCAMKDGKYTTNIWKRHVGERNLMRTFIKNYTLKNIIRFMPGYLAISALEIAAFLVLGRFRVVTSAYLAAYWWNIRNLPDTLRLRARIQAERRCGDEAVLRKMGKKSGKLLLFKKIGIPRFAPTN